MSNKLLHHKRATHQPHLLFLGYPMEQLSLIEPLKHYGCHITHTEQPLNDLSGYDLVISYGYKHILTPSTLSTASGPLVNLHISYLPYNRGAHPNFWSFYDETPSGVSIHLIDEGLDTGPIITQAQVTFDTQHETFRTSYRTLRQRIEALFLDCWHDVLTETLTPSPQKSAGTFHRTSDLPTLFSGWDSVIDTEIRQLKQR